MSNRIKIVLGVCALVAAGVAGFVVLQDDEATPVATVPETTTSTAPETTTSTVAEGPRYPLTGLPVDDESRLARPTLIVKIDNVDAYARPQAGVNQADVVYEEQVEGGVTRFAALFHSQDAAQVGPVRSARSTDIRIGAPFGRPLFAFSGANEVFMGLIRASPMIDLSYDWHPELYTRVPERTAPDNILTPTATLFAADPGDATPPPELFSFREPDDELPATAIRVPGVTYSLGGAGSPVAFTWDAGAGGWKRDQNGTTHVDADGVPITPENVIVQFVDYVDTGLVDVAGSPVLEAQLVGEGDAWVLTDGHLVPSHWARGSDEQVTAYTVDGSDVGLTPGQTWVALLPRDTAQYTPCAELEGTPPGC